MRMERQRLISRFGKIRCAKIQNPGFVA